MVCFRLHMHHHIEHFAAVSLQSRQRKRDSTEWSNRIYRHFHAHHGNDCTRHRNQYPEIQTGRFKTVFTCRFSVRMVSSRRLFLNQISCSGF